MGSQSCLVVTGFILLHVALIVNLVALGSPNWIASEQNSTNPEKNFTFQAQGLWQLCVYEDDGKLCDKLNNTQPAWFVAVEVIYTLGCGTTLLALMGYYVLFIKASNYSETARINSCTLVLITIACTCLIIAIALFGKWGVEEKTALPPPKRFAWSFYTAISGAVVSVLCAVIICREGWLLRATRRPYVDL